MSAVRRRRLAADFEKLTDYVRQHARVRLVQSAGDPPEHYQLEYRIRSLRMVHEELQPVDKHLVEIKLPLNYPRVPPQCRMLSPVFHPNIAPHAICVGDHWSAGESLQSIVARIGEILAYQSYNVKSPLNGEAARWVDENKGQLPLDRVSMLVEEEQRQDSTPQKSPQATAAATSPARTAAPAPTAPPTPAAPPASVAASAPAATSAPPAPANLPSSISCPGCGTSFRMSPQLLGKRVRCTKCQNQFQVPEQ